MTGYIDAVEAIREFPRQYNPHHTHHAPAARP
jgi:hypothetical protein